MSYLTRSTRKAGVTPGDTGGVSVPPGPGSETRRPLAFPRGRRAWVALVVAAAVLVGAVTYMMHNSSTPVPETLHVVRAGYGDVAVTVGGVGRIVPAGSTSAAVPAAAASGTTSSATASQGAGAATAPPDAVFSQRSGTVTLLLVKPGQVVVAGQPIAVLDDAGVTATAVKQRQNDVATARIELQRMLNPLAADLSSLTSDVRRAQADLETLRGGTTADRARAMRIARRNVLLQNHRLDVVLHPRTAADVAAAQAEVRKAEADLAALTTPPPPPLPSALAAAQASVRAASARLTKLTGPPDPITLNAARLEVAKADADLKLILQQVPPATAAEIAAANATLDAATARLAQLLAPADPADVAAAEADLRKAEADLDALQAPTTRPTAAAVSAAREAIAAARTKLANLRLAPQPADVTAARLELERALSELQLLRAGPDPAALAAAVASVSTARARRATPVNPHDIDLARVRLTAAETELSAARITQDYLTVRAVSDGTVTTVLTTSGAPVDTVTPVAVVSDLGGMAADVDVSEFDAAQVRRGLRVVLSVDALGGKAYPGTVLFAAPTGSDAGGVVTFPVRVSVSSDGRPKAGMNVSVRIIVNERRHVIQVPVEAVSRGGGSKGQIKVVAAGGRVSQRTVQLGLANNKAVEVTDGLRAGERIVLPASGGGGDE